MVKINSNALCVVVGLAVAALAGCGKSSSSTPTTVPNSATIFYSHNLVFRNDTSSVLLSTGYNGFGQLGSGNLGSRTAPGPLSTLEAFSGFAVGGNHSVAFLNNSTVRAWGYNAFGQLGNNSTTYSSNPVPVFSLISTVTGRNTIVNLTGVKAVAAGAYHTLALKNDNTVWAWGQNTLGQLGVDYLSTPSFGISLTPVKVNSAGVVLANISSIAANAYHSLALARNNGGVWAWGYNGTGQLGLDPTVTGAMSSPYKVAINTTSGFTSIAAGGAFSYAVDKDGAVWAWGNNDYGQLGNGTLLQSYTPAKVQMKSIGSTLVDLTNIKQVAAGIQHGLALDKAGNVWAWGYNFFGQLGNSTFQDSTVAIQIPSPVPGQQVTEIRAFGSSSMAKVGSAWYVWGDNFHGQLGLSTTGKISTPTKMLGF